MISSIRRLSALFIMLLAVLCALNSCSEEEHVHSFDWSTEKEASCYADGLSIGVCDCGATDSRPIPALEHTLGEWVIDVLPTCDTQGSKYIECTVCHTTLDNRIIPEKGHTVETKPGTPATCTEDGCTDLVYCSECKTVITASVVIPHAGHIYKDEVTSPTCENAGYTTHTCECGDTYRDAVTEKLGHVTVNDLAKAPTCLAEGLTEGSHCSRCDSVLIPQITIPARGHTEVKDHAIPMTCTKDGLTEGVHCSACGTVLVKQEVIPTTGHKVGEWVVDVAPTCDTQGSKYVECTVCHTTLDNRIIPEKGHTVETKPGTPATCTEDGCTDLVYCSECKTVITASIVIPHTGHIYKDEVTSPTCESEGYTTHTCECGDTYRDAVTEKLGHIPVTDPAKDPTCLAEGLTEGSHCSRCDSVLIPQITIPAKGHTEVKDHAIPMTCTKDGLTEGVHCSACGTVLVEQEVIPTTGHKPGEWVTDVHPTCEAQGSKYVECTVCHTTLDNRIIPEKGHTVETKPGTPATCTEAGISDSSYCTECKTVIKEATPIQPLGHTYTHSVILPTCEDEGYTTHTCECGDSYRDAVTEKLGHNTVIDSAIASTCKSSGLTEGSHCSRCYKILVSQVIVPPIDHSYNSTVISPTCEDQGYTTHVCNFCGSSHVTDYTSAKGHLLGGWEVFDGMTVRRCVNSENCPEHQRIARIEATYIGGLAFTDELVFKSDIRLIGYLTNGSKITIYDFTLKDNVIDEVGTNYVTLLFGSFEEKVAITALAANLPGTTNISEFQYTEKNGEITINKFVGTSTNVVIPAHVNNVPVKYIATSAFKNCQAVRFVAIPDSVVTVGDSAFEGCTSLLSVVIGDSVVGVNQYSFKGCTSLREIHFGKNTKTIGNFAFANCNSLEILVIGDAVEEIGRYAFEKCALLESVTIPANVLYIREGAFNECPNLFNLELSEGLRRIEGRAFYKCPITSLVIPESVTSIDMVDQADDIGAFEGCAMLETVVIGNGLLEIKNETFRNCKALKSVIIGDSVASIGICAFDGCSSLEYIHFGSGVEVISNSAFANCTSLTNLRLGPSVKSIGNYTFEKCNLLSSIETPSSLRSIGTGAFYQCTSLRTLVLNEGLVSIGGNAFVGTSITSVTIPDSVILIDIVDQADDIGAFEGCAMLETVVIGNGLSEIKNDTFKNCKALKSVIIGESVVSIGISAFDGCSSLEYIHFGSGVEVISNSAFANCTSLTNLKLGPSVKSIGNYTFEKCKLLSSIETPPSVRSIGTGAFYQCTSLRTLVLNEGLVSIGGNAFVGTSITSVTIPDSVILIDMVDQADDIGAFEGCAMLETVVIGDGLFEIKNETFKNCTSLRSVYIGDSVTTIGWNAFKGCTVLKDVRIGNHVQIIMNYAFADCTAIESIYIPDSTVKINDYAFSGCTVLENVYIGSGVQTLGKGAFNYCTSLKKLRIPSSVQSIGEGAFNDCGELSEVVIEKGNLKTLNKNIFKGCNKFKRIYYGGTESDWNKISINSENPYPLNTTPYFYSSSQPLVDGNFWHYDSYGENAVWNVTVDEYRADVYNEEFLNEYGSRADSLPTLEYLSISNDSDFKALFNTWATLNIIINPFDQVSKALSLQQFYEIAIYDVLIMTDNGETPPLVNMAITEAGWVASELMKGLYGDVGKEIVENFSFLKSVEDLTKEFDFIDSLAPDALDTVGIIIDFSKNAYDAIDSISTFVALYNLQGRFEEVLLEIANDSSNPKEVREAAKNMIGYLGMSFDDIFVEIKNGLKFENGLDIATFIAGKVWDVALKAMGLGSVNIAAKGIYFLMDKTLNMDKSVAAYYQLAASVLFEDALRKIIVQRLDYLRYENSETVKKYNEAVALYKNAMIKGHDYSVIFYDAYVSDSVDTDLIKAKKESLIAEFDAFENSIESRFNSYGR